MNIEASAAGLALPRLEASLAALAAMASAFPSSGFFWHGYCPLGHACSKGNRQLCLKTSREAAIHAVATHLNGSSYHGDTWEQALSLADNEESRIHTDQLHHILHDTLHIHYTNHVYILI